MTRPCVAQPPSPVKRTTQGPPLPRVRLASRGSAAGLTMALSLLLGCSPDARLPAGQAGERPTFRAARWDDGNAEIAQYRVRERRYGTLRDGSATLIVVKERFDPLRGVKTTGPDGVEAIKLNHVLSTPTGVYTYRQMATVLLDRQHARPLLLRTGSQEWCGLTHKRMAVRSPDATLRTSSYFEGEGERVFSVRIDQRTVLYDALPLWLRTLDLQRPGERAVQLVPRQMSSHASRPELGPATILVGPADSMEVPAGRFEAVPVTVRHDGGDDVFHFDARAPHTLVRWDRADGGEYTLEWVRRAPYWRMSDDGQSLAPAPPAVSPAPATLEP